MAAVYPATEVGNISQTILGLTAPQANALDTNGWVDLMDFEGYTTDDIQSWMESMARLARNRGGVVFPSTRAKRVFALSFWVNRRILRGINVDPADFNAIQLSLAMADFPIKDMERDADDAVDKPDPFSYDKWVDWQDSVVTFLKGTKSITKNLSLYYVIRKEPNPTPPANMTEEDEIIYNASHAGAAYRAASTALHTSLTE